MQLQWEAGAKQLAAAALRRAGRCEVGARDGQVGRREPPALGRVENVDNVAAPTQNTQGWPNPQIAGQNQASDRENLPKYWAKSRHLGQVKPTFARRPGRRRRSGSRHSRRRSHTAGRSSRARSQSSRSWYWCHTGRTYPLAAALLTRTRRTSAGSARGSGSLTRRSSRGLLAAGRRSPCQTR